MIRRRRPERRIEFSFDSFLDLVTNVVGIILRLILVAWVGARSYKGPPPPPPPAVEELAEPTLPPPDVRKHDRREAAEPTLPPPPPDPLAEVLEHDRRELARAHAELLARLKELNDLRGQEPALSGELTQVSTRADGAEAERAELDRHIAAAGSAGRSVALTLEELRRRRAKLLEDLEALKREPVTTRDLRYQTPVSSPVQTEELMFEVRGGRVTLLDIGALLEQVKHVMQDRGQRLRTQWEVTDTTTPVGAFRLRYTLERERTALDQGGMPTDRGNFSFSMTAWEAEPVAAERGETADRALAADSVFRRIVDNLDPQQTAVTFWVYPDSFAEYRRLRDYLHGRDVVVAGRPLEENRPIAGSSKYGKRSRGQ